MSDQLVESKVAEAANAAAVAAEAMTEARRVSIDLAISEGLEKYFEGRKSGRFIDINRIPFICDDIRGIHDALKVMQEKGVTKDDFTLVRNIVFGFIGIIVLAFMAALTTMVFK